MPTREQLIDALRKADAAGDTEAAQRFAEMIREMPKAEPETVYSGTILPFSKDAEGSISFDPGAGLLGMIGDMLKGIKSGVTLPGDVYQGKVDLSSPEGIGRTLELSAIGTPINPAVRSTGAALPGMKPRMAKAKVKPPTTDDLLEAGSRGYKDFRGADIQYSPRAVADMAQRAQLALEKEGFARETAPQTFATLRKLQNPPEGSVSTGSNLLTARDTLRDARLNFNKPKDRYASERVIRILDDFIESPNPDVVVAGPAAEAGRTLSKARGNIAAGKRSERIIGKRDSADLQAAVANSGRNIDNALRRRAREILERPKERLGFSEEELKAIREVAEGSATRNTLRYVGNLLGGGGGLGQLATIAAGGVGGSAAFGPMGGIGALLGPAIGSTSKTLANKATKRALGNVDKLVRTRSPLYEDLLRNAPYGPVYPMSADALQRALFLSAPKDR